MIAGAISKVFSGVKDSLGKLTSMPLNGDKVFAEETAGSSARQAEERKKSSSSPIRQTTRAPGGVRPLNNLNSSRASVIATHSQQEYSQPRKRPRPDKPQLRYTGEGKGNPRSSPSLEFPEDTDETIAGSNSEPMNGHGLHSPKARRGPRGHAMLSPLPFQPERQIDHHDEGLLAKKSEDVKWVRKRQGGRDIPNPEDPRATKKRAVEDGNRRWINQSPSDPQPTSFVRGPGHAASPPVSVSSGRPHKPESAEPENFLRLKAVWRGTLCIRDGPPFERFGIRVKDKGFSVVTASDKYPDLSSVYENIEHAAYLDDDSNQEFRNFVSLKLKNRENGLAGGILMEFRALPDPANPGQKSDLVRFRLWLEHKGVKMEPKNHQFMRKRMEDTKEYQFAKLAPGVTVSPWGNSGLPNRIRSIEPKPQPREVERPRTRSNPIPLDEHDSRVQDLEQLGTGTGRLTRKSARTTYKKEVVEIPKPKLAPFPPQTWNQTLTFPFETQGPSELLDASSLRTLNHDEFLNDEIINFHLATVKARLAKENPELARKVYIANTYLFSAFSTKTETGQFNYEKVKRWTKNANLFQKDLIFIPINEKYHWFVAVVCNLPAALAAAQAREKKAVMADELVAIEPAQKPKTALKNRPVPAEQCTVAILDSMVGYHTATLKAVKTYLISEAKEKQKVTLDLEDFTGLMPRKLPGQDNFSDCGLFMLHYIEKWLSEPTRIKEKLYERDFGSEEDARKLWSISEVGKKRERMWKLYVKLNEEYEKCLKKEAFDEFPEIVDAPTARDKGLEEEGAGAVAMDRPTSPPRITQDLGVTGVTEAVERSNSPAKRKSDGRDEADRPPKRAKSDSPVVVVEQPRVTAAPGLRPRIASPEIPSGDDVPCVLEVPETQDLDLQRRAKALENSDIPLIAANGLVSPPFPGNPVRGTHNMPEQIEQMGNFSPPSAKRRPATTTTPQPDSIDTPSYVAAASFGDLSIDSSMDYRAESGGVSPTKGDTIMGDARPRKPIEEIEETEDESLGELTYNGGRKKSKSVHELENDRIMDTSSSQDHREDSTPPKHKEQSTPRGGTEHDPICIDSQSSPKRISPRTKAAKTLRP
ncbi:hypothetical protein TWF106_000594 [Orbilia oligospora]|uniref:Ubiquitin-like protease family profile domain-containing protein n=1 Tax=Orbilia oligospora TaxID=2813651 RepID=A0A7C8QC26_ORBOL|nr:hypothetical protein TWF106_000594 [Orbilia oligospora]